MDFLLLFMRDCLDISFRRCAEYLGQEYSRGYTRSACIGRYWRLKANGVGYDPVPSDELPVPDYSCS
ncbi:hypothetical protein EU556_20955 [Hymenobacter fodinae]|uniref:Uncharacterized protein n=2 Tax=Hymenobacter fodinae TaxID=2510796 RepID=A0A4Z0P381_9BACT|nr:hypothetical protein EU556_20955 [Hymenobacter fodinae]